jgi:hypothetical protein
MKMTLVAAVAGLLMSIPAFAAGVDVRAGCEQGRINQGIRTGELTRPEARRLEAREVHVNREIARDRAINGGYLTRGERARINRQESALSRSIYREKHDGQFR